MRLQVPAFAGARRGQGAGGWIAERIAVAVGVGFAVSSLLGPAMIIGGTVYVDGVFTLSPWRNVFGDLPRWGTLLGNTAIAAAAAGVMCLTLGGVLATALFKTNAPLRRPAIALLLLAAALPLYVTSASAFSIAGTDRWRGNALAVGVIHAVAHLPIVVLIIGAALRSVAAALEEAAMIDGAGPLRVLWSITSRTAAGGWIASLVLVVLWVTTDYSVSDVLLVRTFAEEVYTQYQLQGRPQEPALVCIPQIILFGALLWALREGFLHAGPSEEIAASAAQRRRFDVGRRRWVLGLGASAVGLVLAVGPIASLALRLRRGRPLTEYVALFLPEIRTSLGTSIAAAALSASIGLGLAWLTVRRPRCRRVVALYVVLMLAVPAPVIGMGLIQVFNRPGILGAVYDSPLILVLAYVYRFLPIAVILMLPAVRAVPPGCEAAARVDGCGAAGLWWHVVGPLCLPAMLVTGFIVMILCVGELPCSLLVTPPGFSTVGARFFSLIHYGLYPDAAALCLISIGVIIVPWCGLTWLWRRHLLR